MVRLGEKTRKIFIQILLVIIILAGGVGLLKFLASLRKPPAKKEKQIVAPLLNAEIFGAENIQVVIDDWGTVQPKIEVQVVPQVSGRVLALHDDFVNGGFFKADEPLVMIDQRDYILAVENAESAVAAAQVKLEQEQAEAAVASEEWAMLNSGNEPSSSLVLRGPQIRQANAQLKAAKAQLETAKLNLERTTISMPFNGRIASESVDPGQFINAAQSIATVYATDVVEIVVPLKDEDLAWFDVPVRFNRNDQASNDPSGSEVLVSSDFAGTRHTWTGQVVRTEGKIDPRSRMVNIVIEVADPFSPSNSRPPLVPGMFVNIAIKGKQLENAIRVPRYVVHNANEVWVARNGRLNIREVRIVRRDTNYAYVVSGLEAGAVVVTSPLDTVVDNMKIRTSLKTQPEAGEVSED
jgi:RND family efflux transporter MFP subunit